MTTTNPPVVGNTWRTTGTVKNQSGALATPGAISFMVYDPAGGSTTYTAGQLTNTTTGIYTLDVQCGLSGEWQCLIAATGANSGADLVKWPVGAAPQEDV